MTLQTYVAPQDIERKVADAILTLGVDRIENARDGKDSIKGEASFRPPDEQIGGRRRAQLLDPAGGRPTLRSADRLNLRSTVRLNEPAPAVRSTSYGNEVLYDRAEANWILSLPLLIRILPNASIFKKDFLQHAQVSGWCFLVANSAAAVGHRTAVDFRLLDGTVGKITTGGIVERMDRAAIEAERRFGREAVAYRVGILEVPALQVSALTIEGANAVHFVTYKDPTPDESLTVETARQFGARLAAIVRARTRFSSESDAVDTSSLENSTHWVLPEVPTTLLGQQPGDWPAPASSASQ